MKNFRFFLAVFFLQITLKFRDFINCDDRIIKITSKYIRIYPLFVEFFFNLFEIGLFPEILKNSKFHERKINPSYKHHILVSDFFRLI